MRFIGMIYVLFNLLTIYRYTISINKTLLKIWRQKCWFGVRFVLLLAKVYLANGMTPKILQKCGEQVAYYHWIQCRYYYIQNGNYYSSKLKCVSSLFFCKILRAKSEKHVIDIYLWEGYQSINVSISGQISVLVILVISLCSNICGGNLNLVRFYIVNIVNFLDLPLSESLFYTLTNWWFLIWSPEIVSIVADSYCKTIHVVRFPPTPCLSECFNSSPHGKKWLPLCRRHVETHFFKWKY